MTIGKQIAVLLCLAVAGCSGSDPEGTGTEESAPVLEIRINTGETGKLIPAEFNGLSVETGCLRKDNAGYTRYGGHFISADNPETIQIFKTLGIKHLRVGGGSVDSNKIEPGYEDIDHLFAFARAAGLKVVYSFRLLNGDGAHNAEIAGYIWDNYSDALDCFSIGNEPDWDSYHKTDPDIKDYPSYMDKWTSFANIIKSAVPEAVFTGPDTGSNYPVTGAKNTDWNGKSWSVNFAGDLMNSGLVKYISTHNYVGQDAAGQQLEPSRMVSKMLSRSWTNKEYPALHHAVAKPVMELGEAYRLSESNSFSGGLEGGSNCFATALFALDYLHWWSEHQCSGVDFHNKQWVLNAPIGMDTETGSLYVNPVGYGIAAFSIGGTGYVQPVTAENRGQVNITYYAVRNGNEIYLTLINKEYGNNGKEVEVDIELDKEASDIRTMLLASPEDSPLSLKATLGGSEISGSKPLNANWEKADGLTFRCRPATALIIKIQIR